MVSNTLAPAGVGLVARLLAALEQLNPMLPPEAIAAAVNKFA